MVTSADPYRAPSMPFHPITEDGRQLALTAVKIAATARGGIARTVIEQRFENPHGDPLHVTYRMPLPADGAVSGYRFEIDGRAIVGVVQKKQQARETFEAAIAAGKTAGLLEQQRADIFTQELGNLPPRAALVAIITVDQRLAWLPSGEWEWRFPTVIGPRYSPEDDVDVRIAVEEKVAVRVAATIAIGDATTGAAHSPTHQLRTGDKVALTSHLDRDLVVRWPVRQPEVGCALAVGDKHGLLTIVPPGVANAQPRDLIVLLDASGSMGGPPLETAKRVVGQLIASLDPRDTLELIEFSDSPRRYLPDAVRADEAAKRTAIKWLDGRTAGGGTEIREAVVEALKPLRSGAQRQVVVVTDGYVGGEAAILTACHGHLPAASRLHVLGVGAAVNRSLAAALARAGRGIEVLVALNEDVEPGVKRLLDRTCAPLLTDVTLRGSALVEHAPAHLPDVFAGSPLVAAVAVKQGALIVSGRTAGGTWEQTLDVTPGTHDAALAALFARELVADYESHPGKHDRDIEATGVTFQIATRFTSWVAVDAESKVAGVPRREVVPQMLPHGTTMASFGMRQPGMVMIGAAMPQMVMGYAPPSPRQQGPMKTVMIGYAPGDPKQRLAPAPPKKQRSPLLWVILLALIIGAILAWILI